MRKIIKYITAIILTVLMAASFKGITGTDLVTSTNVEAKRAIVIYKWVYKSKKLVGPVYGRWRMGPVGVGPATLNGSQNETKNLTVSNSISGSFPLGIVTISISTGISLTTTKVYKASYTIKIPKGKKYQIRLRPVYTRYSVLQAYQKYVNGAYYATGKYATAYVDKFSHWEYSYKSI